ncbi:simple sugar transport system ATP-binding protein [Nocardiopsis mwathae]|uniref:Simple sugar transport system ATP-binding protein n=1 Tax=Nocardiopsis mwathae TaxID=1472723 RepID=A0A7W9YLG1_9ACTN|nr:ATP-binding cassette domain-containing protein [Nocardiopsis mwathae]MBB6173731.1 simple sugar transport system ATP-binding protein [Nocardiopsis mwathae]
MTKTAEPTDPDPDPGAAAPSPRHRGEAPAPVLQLKGVGKTFGNIKALSGIDLKVGAGEVTCILGDNGAGKSTLIKIIAGLHAPTSGEYLVDGEPVHFSSPREALDRGIATVYQDLAMVTLMPVWRNFFLGSELRTGFGPFRMLEVDKMRRIADEELKKMGIDLPDIDAPISNLSGGQKQVVAIARAVYFGARVLILDEPTAALGVKQSGVVLKYINAARDAGLGVIFITHNPHHAFMVGDHFAVLKLGRMELDAPRSELTLDDLTHHMAGGAELDALQHELKRGAAPEVAPLHGVSAGEIGGMSADVTAAIDAAEAVAAEEAWSAPAGRAEPRSGD